MTTVTDKATDGHITTTKTTPTPATTLRYDSTNTNIPLNKSGNP